MYTDVKSEYNIKFVITCVLSVSFRMNLWILCFYYIVGGAPPLVCCDDRGQVARDANNPSCAPILFPPNDPIHGPEGAQCQNFLRTGTTRDRRCTAPTAPAEPVI